MAAALDFKGVAEAGEAEAEQIDSLIRLEHLRVLPLAGLRFVPGEGADGGSYCTTFAPFMLPATRGVRFCGGIPTAQ